MQYTDDMIRDLPSNMENEVLETVFIEPGSTSVAKTHGHSRFINYERYLHFYKCAYAISGVAKTSVFFRCFFIRSLKYKIPFTLLIAFLPVDEIIKILFK